jgi:acyl-CoA thioester hydrolase
VHEYRLQTRWTDFDALGHVTHVAYPVFFDEARDAFITSAVGGFETWPSVVAHVSIDYRTELRHPLPEVLVRTTVVALGRTSVTFDQEALAADGSVAATCRAVIVAWDRRLRRPRPLDDGDRARLIPITD